MAEKVRETLADLRQNWRTRIFDELHPIRELDEKAYMLHSLTTGTQATVAMFMEHGILKRKGDLITVDDSVPGFLKWMSGLGNDAEKLLYRVAAKRAERLEAEGRERWLDAATRRAIYEMTGKKPENSDSWDKLYKQFRMYNKSVLDLAEGFGLINPVERKMWEQEFYVPFYRIFEDSAVREKYLLAPSKSRKHISAQIRRLKGAEAPIGDPLVNTMRNWTHLIQESMRNVARREAYHAAKKQGLVETLSKGDLLRILGSKTTRRWAVTKDGGQRASSLFDTKEEADAYASELSRKYNRRYSVSSRTERSIIFGNMKDENVLSFRERGKPVYFRVKDPELYASLAGADREILDNTILKMFSLPKRVLTFGATFGPAFRVANLIKDSLHTFVISKSFTPLVDSMTGFVKSMREDRDYIDLMASGAGFGSSYVHAENPQALAKYVERITKREGRGAVARILDTPKKILDIWEKIGSASENAARVQHFAKRRREVGDLDAAFEARDLLDFTKQGSYPVVKAIIQTVPFVNARMQGNYRLGRAAAEDPKSFAVKGGIITLLSLALWAHNKDRKEWDELEDWDKWSYYHFWIGDKHYRIPKPFEVGAIFSSVFESAADVLVGDREIDHLADFLKFTITQTFAVDLPQAIKPLAEQWANKSTFTGRAIEGESIKRLLPGDRADPWTSETLKLAGRLGVSPKRAEAFIRGYLATVGTFMLGLSDIVVRRIADFPERPARKIDDYPLVGRFVREGRVPRHTRYVTKFYDIFREMDELVATVNQKARLGDYDAARALAKSSPVDLNAWRMRSNKTRTALAKINREIRRIWNARDMTPAQKRARIDKLADTRNKIVREFYEAYLKAKEKRRQLESPR